MIVIFHGLFLVLMSIAVFAALGVAYLIYTDAKDRGVPNSYPFLWAVGSFFIPFIIIPLYAYYARQIGSRSRPFSKRELSIIWLYTTFFTALLVGTMLSPPDPYTNTITSILLLVPCGIVFYVFIFMEKYKMI